MDFFDTLETRDPERREREQFTALQRQIAHAQKNAPYFGRLLAGVNPAAIKDRAGLARLPVTRKSDLTELQTPFGDPRFVPARGARTVVIQRSMTTKGVQWQVPQVIDSVIQDGLWDAYGNVHMGDCGELCAREKGVSRKDQDDFAAVRPTLRRRHSSGASSTPCALLTE